MASFWSWTSLAVRSAGIADGEEAEEEDDIILMSPCSNQARIRSGSLAPAAAPAAAAAEAGAPPIRMAPSSHVEGEQTGKWWIFFVINVVV